MDKALADFERSGWLRLEIKSVVILDRERLARPWARSMVVAINRRYQELESLKFLA